MKLANTNISVLIRAMNLTLNTHNHDRDLFGLTYVYPVISRRAGGVSLGINLNPNNACTWQCIYCQVPNLTRGSAPKIDLILLQKELESMLSAISTGDFMQKHVPKESRVMCDIAISGNGEPSSCKELSQVVSIISNTLTKFNLCTLPITLISNGSFMHRSYVHEALCKINQHGGEVWFKIDRASPQALEQINGIQLNPTYLKRQLRFATQHATTWIQSCFFAIDGEAPRAQEVEDYLTLLQDLRNEKINIAGVQLYGLARPSMQEDAKRLSSLPEPWMQALAKNIEALHIQVKLNT